MGGGREGDYLPMAFMYAELVMRTVQSSVEKFCKYKLGRYHREMSFSGSTAIR